MGREESNQTKTKTWVSVDEQTGLSLTQSETRKTGFLA